MSVRYFPVIPKILPLSVAMYTTKEYFLQQCAACVNISYASLSGICCNSMFLKGGANWISLSGIAWTTRSGKRCERGKLRKAAAARKTQYGKKSKPQEYQVDNLVMLRSQDVQQQIKTDTKILYQPTFTNSAEAELQRGWPRESISTPLEEVLQVRHPTGSASRWMGWRREQWCGRRRNLTCMPTFMFTVFYAVIN